MNFWKTAGLAVTGTSHLTQEKSGQDAVATFVRNGISVIALADGANNAIYSLEGAQIVTSAICKYIAKNFVSLFNNEDELSAKKEMVDDCLHRLNKRAKKYKCDVSELASTLIFVAIREDKQVMIGHIGDGSIVTNDKTGWKIFSNDSKNIANETQFVTTENVFGVMRLSREELRTDSSSFAIMSNGCENTLINKKDPSDFKVAKGVAVMNNWLKTNSTSQLDAELKNTLETQITQLTEDDCSVCFVTKVSMTGTYESLDYEQKQEVFEKYFSHLYNVEGAIEDASFIIKVLKVTDATASYISLKSKIKLAGASKILDILCKAKFLKLEGDVYSLITVEDAMHD